MREARAIQKRQRAKKALISLKRMAELHLVLIAHKAKSSSTSVADNDHAEKSAPETKL